ncbi:hypothetical protein CFO_g2727 [Ceratocystis platani]|uniref:AAA+ ATPase domain-containing protein n=1 Tax=Ceratocystis fimbriata f. sp. platani TaxID=88771 RepID=A0A0F8DG00_CERFI|nr:hypothetical protein CFO_g2727 [Ceratocystis platani]
MALEFKVRPVHETLDNSKHTWKGVSRVYISKESFLALTSKLDGGWPCVLESIPSDDQSEIKRREASLWLMPGGKNVSPNVVQMTTTFRKLCGFELGDVIQLTLTGAEKAPDADTVILKEDGEDVKPILPKDQLAWEWLAKRFLERAGQIFPGMMVELSCVGAKKLFKAVTVNDSFESNAQFNPETTLVKIVAGDEAITDSKQTYGGDLIISDIPGYASQVETLNDFLANFYTVSYIPGDAISCGFVISGGQGTGRTFILNKLAATNWGRTFRVEPADKLSAIHEVFKQARAQKPSMVLVDDFDQMISKDRSNYNSVINFFAQELDSLSAEAVATGQLPQIIVVATCLDYLIDIPTKLQKPQRFYDNVLLPAPDPKARLQILQSFNIPLNPATATSTLDHLAQRTYAFSPGDLFSLTLQAKKIHKIRLRRANQPPPAASTAVLDMVDFTEALRRVKPTAMHDINLKPPSVTWQDIGGQAHIKKTLQSLIGSVMRTSNQRVNPTIAKGVLLYGPPGCSKTLSAQALATESGFNFFSVKGAELLDKYVGESEKAVRLLFARARAASPCIIFFDEIDSLATTRGGGPGNNGGASRSQAATNVVTSLLTEMDGFESLQGVLVVGATNHPEGVDPALMRPGRFDKLLYVGPPDQCEREAIFRLHAGRMPLADGVDFAALASAADGFSGADIKGICNNAGDAVQELVDSGERPFDKAVRMEDLLAAVHAMPRSISSEMVTRYKRWAENARRRV